MSNAKDLGLVNDMIVGVDRTSGDGSPGTVDTYAIRLRSGVTYPFTVTNGDACVKEFTIEKGSIGDEVSVDEFFDYLITSGFKNLNESVNPLSNNKESFVLSSIVKPAFLSF